MAKPSTRARIEKFFNRQVWAVLRDIKNDFAACVNADRAARQLSHLTGGKIDVQALTIFKMIEKGIQDGEVNAKDFFHPWGIPEPKKARQPGYHLSPRKSTRTKIEEHFGKTVWEILSVELKDCNDTKEAAAKLSDLTDGEISVNPATIFNMILAGIDAGEVQESDSYYKLGVKNGKGRRGKESTRDKLENYFKKNLWDWFREEFSDIDTRTEACARIMQLTKGVIQMGEQVLVSTINKGLEKKEITQADPFVKWAALKRKRKVKAEGEEALLPDAPKYVFDGTCQNCGKQVKESTTKHDLLTMGLNIVGRRCQGCQCWASYRFVGTVDGKDYDEFRKDWKGNNPDKFKRETSKA